MTRQHTIASTNVPPSGALNSGRRFGTRRVITLDTSMLGVLVFGVLVFGVLALGVTFIAPLVVPHLPAASTLTTTGGSYALPQPGHPLGTDALGRDVLLLTLTGGARLVWVAALSSVLAMCVGVALGLALTAQRRPLLSFTLNAVLVIPPILVVLVLAFGLTPTLAAACATCVVNVPFVARYTHALAAPLNAAPFAEHARASGASVARVLLTEVLPNLGPGLLAQAGMRFVGAMYLVAAASFLGFADPTGPPDWATMVQANLDGLRLNPWASLAPAAAIAAVTLPMNVLAEYAARERTQ